MPDVPTSSGLEPIAASLRDGNLETLHLGVVSVVDGRGAAVWQAGDARRAFPLRSAVKPMQLLPFLLDGLDTAHAADDGDLAIMMGSHAGEAAHVERVTRLLARFGVAAEALRCGAHPPLHERARIELAATGQEPTALHCNCSGKHAAMLAVCRARGWSLDDYEHREHPLQRRIEVLMRALTDAGESPLPWSVDGCSLPTWHVELRGLARAFAALARPESAPAIEGRRAGALLARLYDAGTRAPYPLAGSGRLDTQLMQRLGARVFAKSGADGLLAMAVRPTSAHPEGLGIAVKVADGDADGSVRRLLASRLLARLDPRALAEAEVLDDGQRRNYRGILVGERVAMLP